jgi:hypothetical protein
MTSATSHQPRKTAPTGGSLPPDGCDRNHR